MTSLLTGLSSWLGSGEKSRQEEFHLWSKGSPNGWYQHSRVGLKLLAKRNFDHFQSSKFSFLRWWRRTLPKHIGLELLTYLVLYYAVNVVYRLTTFKDTGYIIHLRAFLDDEQRRQFGVVVKFFKENLVPFSKDLAFLLGARDTSVKL